MYRFIYLISFVLLFFSGCSQVVNIRTLEPAEIDRVSDTKKISITSFADDRVGLSSKIETKLAHIRINGKNYFTIVSRNDFDKIIKEQKIQNSGLVDSSTAVNVGNLIGAQAIISGRVGRVGSEDTYYYEQRVRCADKKCKELVEYRVRCKKRLISLWAEIKMIDVAKGDIIYGDTFSRSRKYSHCSDDSRAIPSKSMVAQSLANSIADDFVYKLTPHYRYFEVELLDEPDLDYTDKQERLLKVSLEYIEQARYDKAEKFLRELIDSTGSQSYVAFYDMGVVEEAKGKYKEAQEYYNRADSLMIEPVDEINRAVIRIKNLIKQSKITQEQLRK